MQGQKSLTLHWIRVLGLGNKRIVCIFCYNADQYIKKVTMQPFDCEACKFKNCWRSVEVHINHIETAFVHLILVGNESYAYY